MNESKLYSRRKLLEASAATAALTVAAPMLNFGRFRLFTSSAEYSARAIELVGVPTYNRYLVFFPTSWRYFNDKLGMVMRWVLEKPA